MAAARGVWPAWSGGRVPTQRWAASIRRRSRPNTAFSEPAGVPEAATLEEPLAQRVLRQARSGQLDEDRLLPGQDKRERDLTKKLDKLAAQDGWYTFVSAQAHAIATGKAPARRNAEIMVVQEITRWRREVERFAPERLERIRRWHPARAGTSSSLAAPGGAVANIKAGGGGALSRGRSSRGATAAGQVSFFAVFIASRRFR